MTPTVCPTGSTAPSGQPAAAPCPTTDQPITPDLPDPRENWVPCFDGSLRPTLGDCPLPPQAECPGGMVTVPLGQPCPEPKPTQPVPVVCWDGSERASTADCPPGRIMCAGGVSVPLDGQCPAPAADEQRCAEGMVRVMGECTPVTKPGSPPPPPGVPVAREAEPGELMFDRAFVTAGDKLFAQGAGCTPGGNVELYSGGELVATTTADDEGRFETVVHFASFRPGYREVTAVCGVELGAGIDMVLVSSDTSASAPSILLPFFLVLGFLAVRYQLAARGRRASRQQSRR